MAYLFSIKYVPKNIINHIPCGTFRPRGLSIASLRTLEFAAEPSQPGYMYINCMSCEHTPRTFMASSFFLVRYLGLSVFGTCNLINVPSSAPKQF